MDCILNAYWIHKYFNIKTQNVIDRDCEEMSDTKNSQNRQMLKKSQTDNLSSPTVVG